MTTRLACEHPTVTEEPGEPTIGPYYVCDTCGLAFGSLSALNVARYTAQLYNRAETERSA